MAVHVPPLLQRRALTGTPACCGRTGAGPPPGSQRLHAVSTHALMPVCAVLRGFSQQHRTTPCSCCCASEASSQPMLWLAVDANVTLTCLEGVVEDAFRAGHQDAVGPELVGDRCQRARDKGCGHHHQDHLAGRDNLNHVAGRSEAVGASVACVRQQQRRVVCGAVAAGCCPRGQGTLPWYDRPVGRHSPGRNTLFSLAGPLMPWTTCRCHRVCVSSGW